ncbi:MAG: hypothetical protein AABY18_04430 [Candidatus Thermoplasmatota archaeon]
MPAPNEPDPMRRPGDLKRDRVPERPHDPRRVKAPPRDDRKPAGDESTSVDRDDIPDIDPKARAPVPGLPKLRKPDPVD